MLRAMCSLVAVAAVSILWPSASAAQICDLVVFNSFGGALKGRAASPFKPGDEYILCFRLTSAGYVSLWDRMPITGSVERIVPNAFVKAEADRRAVRLDPSTRHCFGTGIEGYFLFMDPADGYGNGVMWLMFHNEEELHPTEQSFTTAATFDEGYKYYGAGVSAGDAPAEKIDDPCAAGVKTLNFYYRVAP